MPKSYSIQEAGPKNKEFRYFLLRASLNIFDQKLLFWVWEESGWKQRKHGCLVEWLIITVIFHVWQYVVFSKEIGETCSITCLEITFRWHFGDLSAYRVDCNTTYVFMPKIWKWALSILRLSLHSLLMQSGHLKKFLSLFPSAEPEKKMFKKFCERTGKSWKVVSILPKCTCTIEM